MTENTNRPLIEVKDLKEYFPINTGLLRTRPLKAVDGVSFSINKGETLGLVGESGCGKTTVGRTLLHLYKPTGGEIYYDGKLIKTIEITADIQAMSIPAFQNWLAGKLAQKMEKAICAAIVNGGGSSANAPVGVGQAGITKYAAGLTGPTLATLSAFMGTLGSAYQRNAIWVMSSKTFFTLIQPLASDVNGVLVQDGIGYRLLGHKVVFEDSVDSCKFKSGSTADSANCDHVIFGDFNNYVFNFGEGISIEADQSVAFRSGSTVYRGMALCDGNVVDQDAFKWAVIAAAS